MAHRCYECGETDDTVAPHEGRYLCPVCNVKMQTTCAKCGTKGYKHRMHGGWANRGTSYRYICASCYHDGWMVHHYCGHVIQRNDLQEDLFGHSCPQCHPGQGSKVNLNLLKVGANDAKFGYGIEVEIDHGDDHEFNRRVYKNLTIMTETGPTAPFWLSRDGSLSESGVELKTRPATVKAHTELFPWDQFHRVCIATEFSSHNTSNCGMHVHVGRTGFGDDEDEQVDSIFNLMVLVERHWEKIVRFSRRDRSEINDWATPYRWGTGDLCHHHERMKDNYPDAKGGEKYRAVNIRPTDTVEIRVFKGSHKPSTIRAAVQFCDVMRQYAVDHTTGECAVSDWDRIFNDQPWSHLNTYLEARGLAPQCV